MAITIGLSDGTNATLQAVVQTSNYRSGYIAVPTDPVVELEKIATRHIPPAWPAADRRIKVIVPDQNRLRQLFDFGGVNWMRALPMVLSVGEFRSVRDPHGMGKSTFLTLVWLQESMVPHISLENCKAMQLIEWDREMRREPAEGKGAE
jgi:hypothetical protein